MCRYLYICGKRKVFASINRNACFSLFFPCDFSDVFRIQSHIFAYVFGKTCFDERFFIPYDNWKTLLSIKFYRYFCFLNRHVVAFLF